MNRQFEQKLYKDFPGLYRQKDLPMTHTCMNWGIETNGDGWNGLIYELSEKIVAMDPEVQAVQVKEKFGGLRFYTGPCDESTYDKVQDLIDEYVEISYHTCEECGSTEDVKQTQGGWIVTLCPVHLKERYNARGEYV